MNDDHPGDALELYALGALERDEALVVEAHAASCAACARRLGEAERAVTSLDALSVPIFEVPAALADRISASARTVVAMRPRRAPNVARWGTLAACFVAFGVGAGGVREIATERATIAADDHALATIAASHFAHTTLTNVVPNAPTAKVLWGKVPHWIYVIVDSPACECDVIAQTPAGERDLGTPSVRGATATLFVEDAPGVSGIELRRGATVLASAKHP